MEFFGRRFPGWKESSLLLLNQLQKKSHFGLFLTIAAWEDLVDQQDFPGTTRSTQRVPSITSC